jgi:hypothetical protein
MISQLYTASATATGYAITETTPSSTVIATATASAESYVSQEDAYNIAYQLALQNANITAKYDANLIEQAVSIANVGGSGSGPTGATGPKGDNGTTGATGPTGATPYQFTLVPDPINPLDDTLTYNSITKIANSGTTDTVTTLEGYNYAFISCNATFTNLYDYNYPQILLYAGSSQNYGFIFENINGPPPDTQNYVYITENGSASSGYPYQPGSYYTIELTPNGRNYYINSILVENRSGSTSSSSQFQAYFNLVAVGDTISNISFGYAAQGPTGATGSVNYAVDPIAIGINAGAGGQMPGAGEIAIGTNAASQGQQMYGALAIGYKAGLGGQGQYAIALGHEAGLSGPQGSYSLAIGSQAGANSQNIAAIALGSFAGAANQGPYAVALGDKAGRQNQATGAIGIGYNAGSNNQGAYSVAIGYGAGQYAQPANSIALNASNTQLNPTSSGFFVNPVNSTTGSASVTGPNMLVYNTTNSQISYDPSSYVQGSPTYNTVLGSGAGIYPGSTNCTAIGANAQVTAPYGNNVIVLGDNNITTLYCNTQTISALSDARDKTNLTVLDTGLDFVNQLKPLRFDWNRRDGSFQGKNNIGFLAQDLLEVQENTGIIIPDLVNTNDPEKYTASYGVLIPIFAKAIQDLKKEVDELNKKIYEFANKA